MRAIAAAELLGTVEAMAVGYSHLDATVNIRDRTNMRSHFDAARPTVPPMVSKRKAFAPDQRRRALRAFMDARRLKVFPWCKAAGISEGTLRNFLNGDSDSLSDRSYELLAAAADTTVANLRGEASAPAAASRRKETPQVELRHYVGAGDVIHIIDGDGGIDWVDAPPGFEKGAAGQVRGDSMLPMFDDGDVIYWRRIEPPPKDPPKRAVIVKVKDGPLYLKKLLPGTKRGRYHLVSINPVTRTLLDQPIEGIARIGWVRPIE